MKSHAGGGCDVRLVSTDQGCPVELIFLFRKTFIMNLLSKNMGVTDLNSDSIFPRVSAHEHRTIHSLSGSRSRSPSDSGPNREALRDFGNLSTFRIPPLSFLGFFRRWITRTIMTHYYAVGTCVTPHLFLPSSSAASRCHPEPISNRATFPHSCQNRTGPTQHSCNIRIHSKHLTEHSPTVPHDLSKKDPSEKSMAQNRGYQEVEKT